VGVKSGFLLSGKDIDYKIFETRKTFGPTNDVVTEQFWILHKEGPRAFLGGKAVGAWSWPLTTIYYRG